MTSTPHKLVRTDAIDGSSALAGNDPGGGLPLTSLEEVTAAVLSAPVFQTFTVETPEESVVSLTRDGKAQIILGEAVWGDPIRSKTYFESASASGIAIVVAGTADDFTRLPAAAQRPDVHWLGLPLSHATLASNVQNIHNFLTLVARSESRSLYIEEANRNVKFVMSISRELNGERDIPRLLHSILAKAREIVAADAGSIYTFESPTDNVRDGKIRFRFTQNHSIKQNLSEFYMPVNESSVVGNAVIHGVTINIPDLYLLKLEPKENPYGTRHDRTWDQRIGYESHSMLTVPMYDISHNVIGVIQLINRKKMREVKLDSPENFKEQVIPFDEVDQEMAELVAQQAGIALENANMQANIQELFDGFVNASVKAIEQRDPTTSGHSHRVAYLTKGLGEVVNRTDNGPYKDTHFNANQLQEIEYASLLHDFGKVGVRENVLVKAKKLYPWEMDRLLTRFELIRSGIEVDYLKRVIEYLQAPDHFPMGANPYTFEFEKNQKVGELEEFLKFISKANEPTVLEQGGFEKLKDIANLHFKTLRGDTNAYLTSEELKALSVSRGSLTREEFAEIQSHVTNTYEFLRQIPWGRRLANVPQIAAKHHEKLDGSGYPTSAEADEIPPQTRMMTIADIFDALTASDRPYKKAVPIDRALDILEMEVKGGKIDRELFRLFKESKVFEPVLDPSWTHPK